MTRLSPTRHAAPLLLLVAAASVRAETAIFEDTFDQENAGLPTSNYSAFANWTVTGGTVDLLGPGFFDVLPGNGLYVDLDGSFFNAGLMTSRTLALVPGDYRLEFMLAGNQRNAPDDLVSVSFAGWSGSYTLPSAQPFTLYSIELTIDVPTGAEIRFENTGGDNVGALLDHVRVIAVPTPGTAGVVVGVCFGLARRRR